MSDKILDAVGELKEAMETANDTAVKAQERLAELEEKSKGMTTMDETLKTMLEASTQAAADADEVKKKIDAIEATQEYIEKAVARMGSTDGENNELEQKAAHEMGAFMRTGTPISAETSEAVTRALCEKSFHGIGDDRKEAEMKTLIAGVNPQGGYFIRAERSATMIQRIFETSPVRGIANIETTNSDTFEIVIDDDEATSGGWVGETSSRGNTDTPDIGLLTIPIHEQFAQPKATQKMLDDAGFDIEGWLSRKVTNKMSRFENTAFVTGNGSQKPRGFLSLDAWAAAGVYERNALEQVNSGSAGAFTGDGVKKLQNALIEDYQARAIFGIKRVAWEDIITLKDGNGAYLLDPRSFKVGDTLTLLGKPVIFMNDMPIVAANSLSMVYGDFSVGYTIVDRIGFRVIRDEVTDKPFIKFYTTKRTGADVTNYESLKIQKLAA